MGREQTRVDRGFATGEEVRWGCRFAGGWAAGRPRLSHYRGWWTTRDPRALGSEVLHPDEELLYTVGLIGRRIGQFVDRRRAEQELQEAEERLRLATEAGRVGLLDWDVLADERRGSGAMAEIYGYPPGEFNLSDEEFLERVHPDDRARVRSTLDAAVAAGAPHELEFRIVRPAGDIRWVDAKGRVHRDEKGVFARVLGVSLDVTQQKRAEEERDRLHSLEVTARAEAAERTGSAASSTIGWPTRWASPTRASSSTRRWRGKILCGPTASCTRRRRW